jgi:hypothetical protein
MATPKVKLTAKAIEAMSLDELWAVLSQCLADISAGRIDLRESARINRLTGKRLRELNKLYGRGK